MTPDELALVRSLEAAVAALRECAEQADRAWESECERADRAEQRMEAAETGRDAERTRADALADRMNALQAELVAVEAAAGQARTDAQAAERAYAEASVSLVALSEHLEAFEVEAAVRRSRNLLARLRAALRGE